MLPELAITSPLIGPFIDRTGLTGEIEGNTHLGVAIWWTSVLGSMRGDVVRRSESNYWRETLAFAQWPDFDFEDIFDALFSEQTERLFDFLDELGEFIRVIDHSPLHSQADRWLNAGLVSRGFSVGHARPHRGGVTIPLVWVFRRKVKARWLGMPYIGVDYLEWTEAGTQLRQGDYVMCGGFATEALRRFAAAQAGAPTFRWLTDPGEIRMSELFETAIARRAGKVPRTNRRSAEEAAVLSRLRRQLRSDSTDGLTEQGLSKLSDNGFLALMRSGMNAKADHFCAELIALRQPLARSHSQLLDSCLGVGLLGTAEALLHRTPPNEGHFYSDYSHVVCRAAAIGNPDTARWAMKISAPLNMRIVEYALQAAARGGHKEIIDLLLNVPESRNFASEAMLVTFSYDVASQQWESAGRWLDLGLRPFSVETSESIYLHDMLRTGGLSILKRIFSIEPPTDASLRKIMHGCIHGGAETEYVLGLSRNIPGHTARMSDLLRQGSISFIHSGYESSLTLAKLAARQGGTLRECAEEFKSETDLLRGHEWRKRQDRLITVVGEFQRAGFADEAKIVASLKRGCGRQRRSDGGLAGEGDN
ncbi:MAG: hypothetical protein QOF24_2311 [Verrucomicrobiota bacterium]|jgi:hypothetical protein